MSANPTSSPDFLSDSMTFMYINRDSLRFAIAVAVGTLSLYWYFFGNRHSQRRRKLQLELHEAQQACRDLEDKLAAAEADELIKSGKEIRVYMDGAWDMMHYGHMNALRLARNLGTKLYVGVNNDESITKCKGPPINCEAERLAVMKSCKFVDETIEDVPYIMNHEYIKYIIDTYKIDIIVHGDDPCIVDGKDVYESAKKSGKFQNIPRTEGISTTDILGRMLLVSTAHHTPYEEQAGTGEDGESAGRRSRASSISQATDQLASKQDMPLGRKSNFMTTSRILRSFSAGMKSPQPTDKVVYLAGAWDLFHAGHCEILKAAKELGDYVIVGVHSDQVVNKLRGANLPIMNLNERCLSVLGCKYVDDVLIDAPYCVTQEMVASLNIHVVVHGIAPGSTLNTPNPSSANLSDLAAGATSPGSSSSKAGRSGSDGGGAAEEAAKALAGGSDDTMGDPYYIPKKLGILKALPVITKAMSVPDMIKRIETQRERLTEKYERKQKAENAYYKNRYNL